jgi:hypothetical protein
MNHASNNDHPPSANSKSIPPICNGRDERGKRLEDHATTVFLALGLAQESSAGGVLEDFTNTLAGLG